MCVSKDYLLVTCISISSFGNSPREGERHAPTNQGSRLRLYILYTLAYISPQFQRIE